MITLLLLIGLGAVLTDSAKNRAATDIAIGASTIAGLEIIVMAIILGKIL
jgi:hypothetical protein